MMMMRTKSEDIRDRLKVINSRTTDDERCMVETLGLLTEAVLELNQTMVYIKENTRDIERNTKGLERI